MSPLWTLFYMTLLTLLTLLALPAARSGDGPRHPTIVATTASEHRLSRGLLVIPYRDDITISILCFDDSTQHETTRLSIREEYPESRQLQAERLNYTTIQVTLIKPEVRRYQYSCTDSFNKYSDNAAVKVAPAMSVEAPGLHHTPGKNRIESKFFVPRGQAYNVSCSAHNTDLISLKIITYDGRTYDLQTQFVNDTTVTATVTDHTDGFREYRCSVSFFASTIEILTDYDPRASEFQCVVYQSNYKLECTWRSSSKWNTFNLFILCVNENVYICSDSTGVITAGCRSADQVFKELDIVINKDGTNSLQLEICNRVFCTNQIFQVKLVSFVKLKPVYDLKINASAHGATVTWRQWLGYMTISAHKVEYRLLGTDWRPVNTSTVRCENLQDTGDCELQLALPCPDAHYDLQVYVKFKAEEESTLWSEPASAYFFTAASPGEIDPACDKDFREVTEKPPLSANLVLYQVRQLISDVGKDKKALKQKTDVLKGKLAKVKRLWPRGQDLT